MTTQEANQAAYQTNTTDMIDIAMQAVEDAMRSVVNSDVEVLRDASNHILDAGGKRVRPRLLMLAYIACGGRDFEHAAPAGAAVELMHTASVVHDDINDHGVIRRGRESVNAIWGRTFALLTGDFLFTAVYSLLAPYQDLNITLAKASTALVEGETLQAWAVKNKQFSREVYQKIIALKTAALFEAAGDMGATLAGASEDVVKAFRTYAFNIGLAFQIIDDVLDIIGDTEKLGKTAGIDLEQGRGFAAIQTDEDTANDAAYADSLKHKLLAGNRIDEARQQAHMLVKLGIEALSILPESSAKEELISLANLVINRDH